MKAHPLLGSFDPKLKIKIKIKNNTFVPLELGIYTKKYWIRGV